MNKYKVTQIYVNAYNVYKLNKLPYPEDLGVHEADSALEVLQKVSDDTGIAAICLHAQRELCDGCHRPEEICNCGNDY